jgi:dihydroorotase
MSNSLIKNGSLHDGLGSPARSVDIRIADGIITEIGPNLPSRGEDVVDATDLLVAPGLIDLHVHVFSGVGLYSVDPVDAGLRTGVTTMLDTGTAGSLTYRNFERFIAATAAEDIYALLNISMIGAIQGHPDFPPYMGDLNDGRHAHVPSAVQCAKSHPKQLVGMKVRLTSGLANFDVKNEWAGFHGVFEAAADLEQPCMIHHAASEIPLATVLETMRPGDIYTHLYHPNPDRGFDASGRPFEAMLEARSRGVVFDVGHGVGAFAWEVAEPACKEFGFWPDTISTDLHSFNLRGPVFDMPTTMSKFLYLGMPMAEVIRASTFAPAKAMQKEARLGSIEAGKQADIVLLDLVEGQFPLTDVKGHVRTANRKLVPKRVCKGGVWHETNS